MIKSDRKSAFIIAAGLVLLAGFGLRAVSLGARTMWYDEAFAVLFSEKGLDAMLYGTLALDESGAAADVHPLLYYGALQFWMLAFGQSPAMVRLLSVFAGILTLAALYALARDLFKDRRAGLAAAIIGALAPFHIAYSQEARMYAVLALFDVLAAWLWVRACRRAGRDQRSWPLWIGFGAASALAMYAQQLAAFFLLPLGLIGLSFARREVFGRVAAYLREPVGSTDDTLDAFLREIVRRAPVFAGTVGGVLVALILYLPWLVQMPAQLGKIGQAYWIERPTLTEAAQTLMMFTTGLPLPGWALPISLGIGLALAVLGVYRAIRARKGDRFPAAFALVMAFGPPALMFAFSQWRPVYLIRALLPSALMFYIGMAWLLARGRLPRPLAWGLAGVWLIGAAAGWHTTRTLDTFPRSPYRQAARDLGTIPGDAVIVHSSKMSFLPMAYYARLEGVDLDQRYVRDAPGSPQDTLGLPTQEVLELLAARCSSEAAGGSARVWFVVQQREIAEYGGIHPRLEWFRQHYALEMAPTAYNDLLIYPFTGPDAAASAQICTERSP